MHGGMCAVSMCIYKSTNLGKCTMSVVLHVVCGGAQCRRRSNGVNEWCPV